MGQVRSPSAAVVASLLLAAACSSGDLRASERSIGDAGATSSTAIPLASGLPPCAEARHVVVFDFFGSLTMNDRAEHEAIAWIRDPSDEPRYRSGGAEVAQAYRSLGYEILYIHTAPTEVQIGGQPIADAMAGWLERHGFPLGDGVHFGGWSGSGNPLVGVTDHLIRFAAEGASVDAGYTRDGVRVEFMLSGGIRPERLYVLGPEAGAMGTPVIPGDDLVAHAEVVRTLGPVCDTVT